MMEHVLPHQHQPVSAAWWWNMCYLNSTSLFQQLDDGTWLTSTAPACFSSLMMEHVLPQQHQPVSAAWWWGPSCYHGRWSHQLRQSSCCRSSPREHRTSWQRQVVSDVYLVVWMCVQYNGSYRVLQHMEYLSDRCSSSFNNTSTYGIPVWQVFELI